MYYSRKSFDASSMIAAIPVIFAVIIILASCTPQHMAKNYGGSMDYYLEPNQKLVEVTWKDSQLWTLTKPMKEADEAETYSFSEKTAYGILEGSVTIYETKLNEQETERWESAKSLNLTIEQFREFYDCEDVEWDKMLLIYSIGMTKDNYQDEEHYEIFNDYWSRYKSQHVPIEEFLMS